jgi:hypothetical protein
MFVFLSVPVMRCWPQDDNGPQTSAEPKGSASVAQQSADPSAEVDAPIAYEGKLDLASGLPPDHKTLLNLGLTLNQGIDVAPEFAVSPSYEAFSVTRMYGVLQLTKTNRRFETNLDYKGGGIFHVNSSNDRFSNSYIQQCTISENISGARTGLLLEDAMFVAPGGNFGAQAFGGSGALNSGSGGGTPVGTGGNLFGNNYFGGLGQGTNVTNIAVAQLTRALSMRSSFQVSGGYTFSAYLGNSGLIDNRLATIGASYSYKLSARANVFVSYSRQEWQYPGSHNRKGAAGNAANTVQLGYSRQLTNRLTAGFNGGAQFIGLRNDAELIIGPVHIPITVKSNPVGATANAYLTYSLRQANLGVSYDHLVTGGSGYFAGSTSDIAQFSVSHPIGRDWVTSASSGFSRLSSLGNGSSGIVGNVYEYVFAGVAASRIIGQHFSLSATYQFNDDGFSKTTCATSSTCGLGQQHVASLVFSWRTRPARVD